MSYNFLKNDIVHYFKAGVLKLFQSIVKAWETFSLNDVWLLYKQSHSCKSLITDCSFILSMNLSLNIDTNLQQIWLKSWA